MMCSERDMRLAHGSLCTYRVIIKSAKSTKDLNYPMSKLSPYQGREELNVRKAWCLQQLQGILIGY